MLIIQTFKNRLNKKIASVILLSLFCELIIPLKLWALTSGPTQPEYAKFQPINANEMVDPFTGDLKYNIPLFDIGGYPVNLVYSGSVGVEEEASWTGLGWNVNVGNINRVMRGVPDDFKGEQIVQKEFRKPRTTFKALFQKDFHKHKEKLEFLYLNGKKVTPNGTVDGNLASIQVGLGLVYDSYKGIGVLENYNIELSQYKREGLKTIEDLKAESASGATEAELGKLLEENKLFNFGMNYNSLEGTKLNGSVPWLNKYLRFSKGSLLFTPSFEANSISGLTDLGVQTGYSLGAAGDEFFGQTAYLSLLRSTPIQYIPANYYTSSINLELENSVPKSLFDKKKYTIRGTLEVYSIMKNTQGWPAYGYFNQNVVHESNLSPSAITDFSREDRAIDDITPVLPVSQWTPDLFVVSGHGISGNYIGRHKIHYAGAMPNQNYVAASAHIQGEIGQNAGIEAGMSVGENINVESISSWGSLNSEELARFIKKRSDYNLPITSNIERLLLSSANLFAYYTAAEHKVLNPTLEGGANVEDKCYVLSPFGGFPGNSENMPSVLGQKEYVKPEIIQDPSTLTIMATNNIVSGTGSTAVISPLYSNIRTPKAGSMIILTALEAENYGIHKELKSYGSTSLTQNGNAYEYYSPNITGYTLQNTTIDRTTADRKDHHIGEIQVFQPGGGRYIYGQPVYNLEQHEYRFNVSKSTSNNRLRDDWTGLITDIPSQVYDETYITNNGNDNGEGIDGFFHKREIPAHADNFLLTEVLSADYVDNDNVSGPSEYDFGNYVKFNYTYAGKQRWRNPVGDNSAYMQQNDKFDKEDDHGVFTTGVKELWYLHSIESKTHIAIFFTEKRRDAGPALIFGDDAANRTSGRLLRSIEIYSLKEFKLKGTAAIPEKTIHLEYSYDLCPLVSNHESSSMLNPYDHPLKNLANTYNGQSYNRNDYSLRGKLTLQKLWFTFGASQWETAGSYLFEYDLSQNVNFNYAPRAMDMWGTYMDPLYYKRNLQIVADEENIIDYPYTAQNYEDAKRFASAYKLKRIHLPSGGIISIDYEADDYAYVQDRKAMRLYPIASVGNDIAHQTSTLPTGYAMENLHSTSDKGLNPWIFVKVPSGTYPTEMIDDQDLIFFSSMVRLDKNENYHSIQGYTEYSPGSVTAAYEKDVKLYGSDHYFAFRTIPVKYKKKEVHPITKFSWQYIRDQVPYLMNPGSARKNQNQTNKIGNIVGSIFGALDGQLKMVRGEADYFLDKDFGISIDLNRSYVRLNELTGFKYGGGYRVKAVTISDEWNEMASPELTSSYTVEYNYTTTRDGKVISSGVATMEPIQSRENPLKRPVSLPSPLATRRIRKNLAKFVAQDIVNSQNTGFIPSNSGKLMTNTLSYAEGPIGETLYPAPTVGYSKVTILNKGNNVSANIVKHGVGKQVLEYYTAKDYPVKATADPMTTEKLRLNDLSPITKFKFNPGGGTQGSSEPKKDFVVMPDISYSNEVYGAAQGFLIELNDMHGKPKAVYSFGVDDTRFTSATIYKYHETVNQDGTKELTNQVTVIQKNGTHASKELGVEIDFSYDSKRIKSANTSLGLNLDYDQSAELAAIVISPKLHYKKRESRILTFTKVVTRHGILKEIETIDNGNSIIVQNLAFDGESGSVLLSATQNEFDDWIYSLTKPAYWMYTGLQGAWKNIDIKVELDFASDGKAEDYSQILVSGDELIDLVTFQRYWVLHSGFISSTPTVVVIDQGGNAVTSTTKKFRLIRSGHRELVQAPAETITLMRNPLNWTNVYQAVPNAVLAVKAYEYYENTQLYHQPSKCLYVKCSQPEASEVQISFSPNPENGYTPFCLPNSTPLYSYATGNTVNPYYIGISGIWRPFKEWAYYDRSNTNYERSQFRDNPNDPNTTNIRYAGALKEYLPFWKYNGQNWINSGYSDRWTSTEWLTVSDNLGSVLESTNPLEIPKSSLLGYNKNIVTAVCANSKYNEMLYDGFEDYDPINAPWIECVNGNVVVGSLDLEREYKTFRHWPLWKALVNGSLLITDAQSHTGWNSLKLKPGVADIPLDENQNGIVVNTMWEPYKLTKTDFIQNFFPTAKKYHISFWYKEEVKNIFSFAIYDSNGSNVTLEATDDNGKLVNGWKKADYTFTVVQGLEKVNFRFTNSSQTSKYAFIDDFRIAPEKSSMQSFVYDPNNYRLMATLDDNNYATYYEYNPDGSLARTKVETEKGIATVSEGKSNIRK